MTQNGGKKSGPHSSRSTARTRSLALLTRSSGESASASGHVKSEARWLGRGAAEVRMQLMDRGWPRPEAAASVSLRN